VRCCLHKFAFDRYDANLSNLALHHEQIAQLLTDDSLIRWPLVAQCTGKPAIRTKKKSRHGRVKPCTRANMKTMKTTVFYVDRDLRNILLAIRLGPADGVTHIRSSERRNRKTQFFLTLSLVDQDW